MRLIAFVGLFASLAIPGLVFAAGWLDEWLYFRSETFVRRTRYVLVALLCVGTAIAAGRGLLDLGLMLRFSGSWDRYWIALLSLIAASAVYALGGTWTVLTILRRKIEP